MRALFFSATANSPQKFDCSQISRQSTTGIGVAVEHDEDMSTRDCIPGMWGDAGVVLVWKTQSLNF